MDISSPVYSCSVYYYYYYCFYFYFLLLLLFLYLFHVIVKAEKLQCSSEVMIEKEKGKLFSFISDLHRMKVVRHGLSMVFMRATLFSLLVHLKISFQLSSLKPFWVI